MTRIGVRLGLVAGATGVVLAWFNATHKASVVVLTVAALLIAWSIRD